MFQIAYVEECPFCLDPCAVLEDDETGDVEYYGCEHVGHMEVKEDCQDRDL